MRERLWRTWVVAGTLAVAAYYLVPANTMGSMFAYNAIGLVSAVLILLAIRLHRPEHAAMWYWFGAGQIMWVVGDFVYGYYELILLQEPFPSWADAFYLSSYPMLVVGFLALLRGRRDLGTLVDAAIVGTGLGLAFWLLIMRPIAVDSDASWLERAVNTAYPAADALLLAILVRLFSGGGRGTSSLRLLGGAAALLLLADIGFSLSTLYADGEDRPLDALWLLSYVLWAAAALHPSMRTSARAAPARMSPRRLVLLTLSSLLAPVLLFVPGVGDDALNRTTVAFGAVVLFLLVVLRMAGFVGEVGRQARQLAEQALRDDLTGLPNRRRFEREVAAALDGVRHTAGRPWVLLLDLDGFKAINDDLGHSVGDELLVVVARRIGHAVHPDSLVARMGGDEFAILLPDASAGDVAVVVDRLGGALREPIRAGHHELLTGASIGSADTEGIVGGSAAADEVLRRADVAMYAAKRDGEPHRAYDPDLDESAGVRARVGAELRTALDAAQFRLAYQPIVTLPEGRLVAVESLVRWDHPERGLVSPAEFVPIAEQNGLIVELGAWILRTACRQAAEWRAERGAAAPERISVNVSARQLTRPGFAALVAEALDAAGLPAHCLVIEVTETAVFPGGPAVAALHQVRELGVRIALDDFGTGHSSLGLLQTVPVDILKVDKSFVDNVTLAGRHAVIAGSLVDIGAGLGLTLVAEGVETAEQATELHRLGYRLAQGYHFGRPAPTLPREAAPTAARAGH